MGDMITLLIGFGVCTLLFNVAEFIKYKSADIGADYDQEKAVKRIYRSCKRKWSCDKKGTLKSKYRTLENYINYCLDNEFGWRDYCDRLY